MSYQKIQPRLYIKTSIGGSRSWVYRYRLAGLTQEKGLGSVDGTRRAALTEPAAKKRAAICDGLLAQGIDPWGQRASKQVTFGEIIHEIIDTHKNHAVENKRWVVDHKGKCDTEGEYLRLIDKDAKRLAKMQFNHPRIEDEVELALKPFWGRKTGDAMRIRIYKAFERAKARKVFPRDAQNPADLERITILLGAGYDSRSKEKGGDVKHYKSLPWKDVPVVLAALHGHDGMAAAGLRFLILTVARAANVRFCKKADIDRAARTWTVPAEGHSGERMKAGVEHTYHLNDEAMAIVNALWDLPSEYLFHGKEGKPINETAIDQKFCHPRARGGLGYRGAATIHGFRTAFGGWVRRNHPEKEAFADAMLAHAEGKVKQAYFREDAVEVAQFLSSAWGRHCAGGNVVPIRKNETRLAA